MQQVFSIVMHYFRSNRGKLPKHLFVIRDGISEGQYKYVSLFFNFCVVKLDFAHLFDF